MLGIAVPEAFLSANPRALHSDQHPAAGLNLLGG